MKRRGILVAAVAALTGCAGSLPRATGPRTPPNAPSGGRRRTTDRPDLYIETFDAKARENGDLSVSGTVANRGDVRRTGTVTATVTAGEESSTNSVGVTVEAGGETDFGIPFDVSYERFERSGDVNVRVSG